MTEKSFPCVEVFKRTDGRWAWRLRAGNQAIIATDGGQGYENKAEAVSMADRIIRRCEFSDVEIWRPRD
jgi:uncharacterized protein YegP (UPF0339 family)